MNAARTSRRAAHRRLTRELSADDYAALLAVQDGHCALCPAVPKTRRLDYDHDHKAMRGRGLLCHRCNRALPSWVTVEWLLAAVQYLHHPPADRVGVADGRERPPGDHPLASR